ncbi:MAG TPA: NAD(P)-dependent oxidoreductase [Terriglobales bacterium]
MSKPHVAILGLGIMGSGMAGRLLSAGFPLAVYNRNREKATPFSNAGALVAGSPREAAATAEIIISMVADDAASRAIWLGGDGALAGAGKGAILIESSTLTVAWVLELAAAAAKHGCEFLDAPVTGTKSHAASGELLFLVGGPDSALAKARPVLSVLGRDTVHLGGHGSGALMKLINNFMSGVQAASFAEAAALVDAGGIDREKAWSILSNGAPGSLMVKTISSRAAAADTTVNFALRLMAKDLKYATEEATERGLALHTAASALAVFEQAIAKGHGDEDLSAVVKSLRRD